MNKKTILILLLTAVVLVGIIKLLMFINQEKAKPSPDKIVRKPAFAGQFYSADKRDLNKQIEKFLNNAKSIKSMAAEGKPRILIVPHAGYNYSGQTAAYAFNELNNTDYKTVVLLGSAHQHSFKGAALPKADYWETPLGNVEINKQIVKQLDVNSEQFKILEEAHAKEHSLEVELPFLQKTLSNFTIVPILLGQNSLEEISSLLEPLSAVFNKETLLVISTDLSHYPNYENANKVDEKTIDSILSGDVQLFQQAIQSQMQQGVQNLDTCACGKDAVIIGMALARNEQIEGIELLDYSNSGDATYDKSRVVGYASIAFYAAEEENNSADNLNFNNSAFSKEEQNALLEIARASIQTYLTSQQVPEITIPENLNKLNAKQGAFVTLHKNGELRGCIGQIVPTEEPLWKVVQSSAVSAATKDQRFSPLQKSELKNIKIEISVLSVPKQITNPEEEIKMGRHGVIIQQGQKSGVFLPQVAESFNNDLNSFMAELCSQKAGLSKNCWKNKETKIFTFTADVFSE